MHILTSSKKLKRRLIVLNVENGWNMIAAQVLSADTTNDATTTGKPNVYVLIIPLLLR
jgi:hypothetical protein